MIELTRISVELIDKMGTDKAIVDAARVSVKGDEKGEEFDAKSDIGLLSYLMRNRHGSPFEHAVVKFLVTAPVAVWREHHRHRIASYNEESGRYRVLRPRFYLPAARTQQGKPGHYSYVDAPDLQGQSDRTLLATYSEAYKAYTDLLDAGVAREVARFALPVGLMSSCYVTMNVRALMNFLSLRVDDPRAAVPTHPMREIQEVAEEYEEHFSALFPWTWQAFVDGGRVAP